MSRVFASIDGILLLNKPLAISSNLALQKAKRLLQAKKAGHTGSLDPLASGMLPLCFGEATKFARFLLEANKCYEFSIRLGVTTTTGDVEGDDVSNRPVPELTVDKINALLTHFHGAHQQIPPMYSALKHHGQPLYKLARAGKVIERQARNIFIEELILLGIDVSQSELKFRVKCSKGTYIRSLAEDMGEYLGCGAHVSKLHRVWSAPFYQAPMISLEELAELSLEERLTHLLPITRLFPENFPQINLSDENVNALFKGQVVKIAPAQAGCVKLLSVAGGFLGVGEVKAEGQLVPCRLLARNPLVEFV